MGASEREGKAAKCLPPQDDSSKRQCSTVSKQDIGFHETESVSNCFGVLFSVPKRLSSVDFITWALLLSDLHLGLANVRQQQMTKQIKRARFPSCFGVWSLDAGASHLPSVPTRCPLLPGSIPHYSSSFCLLSPRNDNSFSLSLLSECVTIICLWPIFL